MGNICSLNLDSIVSRCLDCANRQANYILKIQENHKALSLETEKLKARREDLIRRVRLAEQQLRKPLNQVQVWLSSVETTLRESEELISEAAEEIAKSHSQRCLCECKSGYKFGRRVAKKLEEVVVLREEADFHEVAENEAPFQGEARPIEPTVGLKSEVWTLLEDKNVGIIGLYGLGGVGKTTLLTQINNKLSSPPIPYDFVIWVVVSKGQTIENLQDKILEKISPSRKNESSGDKAQDIYRILSRKRFVLLLDDLWERVDLIKVGIPLPSQENDSKVVFTTRLSHVCGEMEAKAKIEVKCLEENQAWTLFQQKVGEDVLNSHLDIRELAKVVAGMCGGLPLALIVIGRAMTGKKSPKSWEFAIEVLKRSAHTFARIGEELYPILKFSFDHLPSETLKSCFLYFSLFPQAMYMSKSMLIDFWFWEGLLLDSLSLARLQGHDIIDSLVNANLLEQTEDDDFVKMHDVIRDMALWISCEQEALEKRYFVQAGLGVTELPEVKLWKSARRVSLMKNKIRHLTATPTPVCPHLQTLFLNKNFIEMIGDDFFNSMPNLKFLNLAENVNMKELPNGISNLVSLEFLDLSCTRIKKLPSNLKKLANLKYLVLGKQFSVLIPDQLISSLSKLQVFKICGVIQETFSRGEDWTDANVRQIEELGGLQHLNSVALPVKSVSALQKLLSFPRLRGCIESMWLVDVSDSSTLNFLYLTNMEQLENFDVCMSDIKMVTEKIKGGLGGGRMIGTPCFQSLCVVRISYCNMISDITWLIFAPSLTVLEVETCPRMREIISAEVADQFEFPLPNPFPKLQILRLWYLPTLKSIYWDVLPFPCMKQISVQECSELKKLPLNANSAKDNQIIIHGERTWWDEIKWEDEATEIAFRHSFLG